MPGFDLSHGELQFIPRRLFDFVPPSGSTRPRPALTDAKPQSPAHLGSRHAGIVDRRADIELAGAIEMADDDRLEARIGDEPGSDPKRLPAVRGERDADARLGSMRFLRERAVPHGVEGPNDADIRKPIAQVGPVTSQTENRPISSCCANLRSDDRNRPLIGSRICVLHYAVALEGFIATEFCNMFALRSASWPFLGL